MAYSPMMQQYLATKDEYKDCILFYRLGDFYEMFFDDAVVAAKEIDLVLTSKSCGDEEKAPMCGVPFHAAETYIGKLIDKGYKVAIAEQLCDPSSCKGIVPRDVIRVITPGTVISESMLSDKDNNYLFAVYYDDDLIDLSWCDLSTGEFCAAKLKGSQAHTQLIEYLTNIQPKEIICNLSASDAPELYSYVEHVDKIFISKIDTRIYFDKNAVSMLLAYLKDTQKQDILHLEPLKIMDNSHTMRLDRATIKNLEITETLFEKKIQGSLLGVLDNCKTAMGSRKMKQWLKEPLTDISEINLRLDSVEELFGDIITRNNIRTALKSVYDLERLIARMSLGTANAKDIVALKMSLSKIPDIKAELNGCQSRLLIELNSKIDSLEDLHDLIDRAIVDEPPFSVREGGLIKPGYSSELDEINLSAKDGRMWIAGLESSERERTGIKNLKVGYNKVFGYYIEISKSQVDQAPDNYIRKQTLVGGERFVTPELKEIENTVLNAQAKTNELEYSLFCELRRIIRQQTNSIQNTSIAIACVDVLCSFAEASVKYNYTKPEISENDTIEIIKGRHPVIENTIADGQYISNDLYLDRDKNSLLLITGPNMAGKSTYMRQLALIVLMAQSGCFVPANLAKIGICDRIYTRIGASDNITMGQSTFFVEMSELAYILNTATTKSLIILDEIGRGTSTYDGLSIAWAVVDNLTKPSRQIRTLFATHYHELTALADSVKGVKNLSVDVADVNGSIVFLHKIVNGAASRSYGIHVAKLAGVPKSVLDAANEKLSDLENRPVEVHAKEEQLALFNASDSVLAQKIRNLDLMNITPSNAIKFLEDLKEIADDTNN